MSIFRRFWRKAPATGMRCTECGKRVRKFEHYVILAAKHKDCRDPKMVGQKSLEVK